MSKRARTKKPGTVTKIIRQPIPDVEKAQIELHDGDELYREIRVENELEDETGQKVKLKLGDDVEVTIETDLNKRDTK